MTQTDDCDNRRRWRWMRVIGAQPAEAVYLAGAHPGVDPGRLEDIPTAADLLAAYRADRQPAR
jgi:hypothetical protein